MDYETEQALLVAEIDHLRSIVAEQEQHLESLQNKYAQATTENHRLRSALEDISNMGEGYDAAMVIAADKALDA